MKAFGIVNYTVEDVFNIFVKNAKKDFSDFNEENAIGCKIEKNLAPGAKMPLQCTIEITEYIKNEKYQITTSTNRTTCTSTYTFEGLEDGTTKLIFDEQQGGPSLTSFMLLWVQRFLYRRQFKEKYKNLIEILNNELRIQFSNIERSKPKDKVLAD
jgi:hypothetical protein